MATTRNVLPQPCPLRAPATRSRSAVLKSATPSRSKLKKGVIPYGPPWPKKEIVEELRGHTLPHIGNRPLRFPYPTDSWSAPSSRGSWHHARTPASHNPFSEEGLQKVLFSCKIVAGRTGQCPRSSMDRTNPS